MEHLYIFLKFYIVTLIPYIGPLSTLILLVLTSHPVGELPWFPHGLCDLPKVIKLVSGRVRYWSLVLKLTTPQPPALRMGFCKSQEHHFPGAARAPVRHWRT